jgi:peptide subunit release factor 1 (eRF1)
VTVLTEDHVRRLASLKGEGSPITSCYLDVDGSRFVRQQDYEKELDLLLRRARTEMDGELVESDLERIEHFVKSGIDRSHTRGLAIFACGEQDLFEVIPLPVPVRSRIVVNRTPAVTQLEQLLEESERIAVLLVDKQRVRLLVFALGELMEHDEVVDELPRDYDDRGQSERGGVDHHIDELLHQHVRHAAAVAFEVFQREAFDHLAIGAPDALASELEDALHPYLRERMCDRVSLTPTASLDEVRSAALQLEAAVERQREAELVAQLRGAVAADRRGVAGLDDVLLALAERRVQHLLVSAGFEEPGWHCPECEALSNVGRQCRRCGATMTEVVDVVEDAVEEALAQGCRVEVCVDNADLDVLGRIGAILRF